MKTCSIEGCEKPIYIKIRGLCQMHYARWQRQQKGVTRKSNCERKGYGPDGRPYCVHGPMRSSGQGRWLCAEAEKRRDENNPRRSSERRGSEYFRNYKRKKRGTPLEAPIMSRVEAAALGRRRYRDLKIESDPKLLEIVHHGDPKAKKMIDLFLHPETPEEERVLARDFLRKRRYTWRGSQITSAETQTTQQETKSPRSLAVTAGA